METNEKEFLVMSDGQHEYIIKESTNKKGHRILRLLYSEAEFWNSGLRGTEVLKMIDTGNGIKLSKGTKKMDYSQLAELRLLLSFSKTTDENPVERDSFYEIYSKAKDSVAGFIKI